MARPKFTNHVCFLIDQIQDNRIHVSLLSYHNHNDKFISWIFFCISVNIAWKVFVIVKCTSKYYYAPLPTFWHWFMVCASFQGNLSFCFLFATMVIRNCFLYNMSIALKVCDWYYTWILCSGILVIFLFVLSLIFPFFKVIFH